MFDNILRDLVVEFRTQHSALLYASGGMLGQSEDFQIYSYKWYRRPYMFFEPYKFVSSQIFQFNLRSSMVHKKLSVDCW